MDKEKEAYMFSKDKSRFFKVSAVLSAGYEVYTPTGGPVFIISVYLSNGSRVQVDRADDENKAKTLLAKLKKELEKAME